MVTSAFPRSAIHFVVGLSLLGPANGIAAPKENTTVSVTATMSFIDPIVITENNPLQFGVLSVAMAANDSITIGTDDSLGGSTQLIINGNQAAADLTVTSGSTASITIAVSAIVNGAGYNLHDFMCAYNSGPPTACDGIGFNVTSVASAPLKIGATLTGNGSDSVGLAYGSFDVTINYQ